MANAEHQPGSYGEDEDGFIEVGGFQKEDNISNINPEQKINNADEVEELLPPDDKHEGSSVSPYVPEIDATPPADELDKQLLEHSRFRGNPVTNDGDAQKSNKLQEDNPSRPRFAEKYQLIPDKVKNTVMVEKFKNITLNIPAEKRPLIIRGIGIAVLLIMIYFGYSQVKSYLFNNPDATPTTDGNTGLPTINVEPTSEGILGSLGGIFGGGSETPAELIDPNSGVVTSPAQDGQQSGGGSTYSGGQIDLGNMQMCVLASDGQSTVNLSKFPLKIDSSGNPVIEYDYKLVKYSNAGGFGGTDTQLDGSKLSYANTSNLSILLSGLTMKIGLTPDISLFKRDNKGNVDCLFLGADGKYITARDAWYLGIKAMCDINAVNGNKICPDDISLVKNVQVKDDQVIYVPIQR